MLTFVINLTVERYKSLHKKTSLRTHVIYYIWATVVTNSMLFSALDLPTLAAPSDELVLIGENVHSVTAVGFCNGYLMLTLKRDISRLS